MKKVILSSLSVLFSIFIFAHSYWLEVQGTGKPNELVSVHLYFGEYEKKMRLGKPATLKNMETFTAWYIDDLGKSTMLQLQKDSNSYKAVFIPTSTGTYTIMMKEDSRVVQDWKMHGLGIVRPMENLKVVYAVGKSKSLMIPPFPNSMLDITGNIKTGDLTVKKQGITWSKIAVRYTTPSGQIILTSTNSEGKIKILMNEKGLYLIDLDFSDLTPGEFNSKLYHAIRYKYALSIIK